LQTPIVMSINISAVQITEPTFVNLVKKIIAETECNPFEITESVFISSMEYVIGVLG
jgi:EAL domain-containing protein (putative c-di-GMP-specific phosphodiesterase class I)